MLCIKEGLPQLHSLSIETRDLNLSYSQISKRIYSYMELWMPDFF